MDWLRHNPIADMPGPEFLLIYFLVCVGTIVTCFWVARRRDPTRGMPLPRVPENPDPYEIAYLRGAENELARVVILGLIQRGFLQVWEEPRKWWQGKVPPRIQNAPNQPDGRHLSDLETCVADWFSRPLGATEIFQPAQAGSLKEFTKEYETRLRGEQLLTSAEARKPAWRRALWGALVIGGLGGYKYIVALSKGKSNVAFLITLGLIM